MPKQHPAQTAASLVRQWEDCIAPHDLPKWAEDAALTMRALVAASSFPTMTPELAAILGTMCFQCIHFAQALRAAGHEIKSRAEDEQAATLHWMLGHYFRHGEDWRKHAAEDMERMRAACEARTAQAQGGPHDAT